MSWFQDACRNVGLMLHHVGKGAKTPAKPKPAASTDDDERVIVRRTTTVEEVELRRPRPADADGHDV
jgi:hypothetical protein